jgi:hypothetical protein
MKASRSVQKITGQVANFDRKIKTVPPESFFSRMKRMGGAGMMGQFATVAGGVMLLRNSFSKMDEQLQGEAQVMQGIKSTNNAAGISFAELAKEAKALQDGTVFGDETILGNVTAQLQTFTNITGSNFKKLQQTTLDVTSRLYGAKASGESLRSTSIMLGKALNDPVANLGALSRAGIQFSEEQKEMIKNMWKAGQTAEAQSLIIAELQTQYGGSAKAAAEAGLGPWRQLSVLFGDFQEKIASGLLPVITKFSKFMKRNFWIIEYGVPILIGLIATIKILTIVTNLFNITLAANPIGLIILGVAALIAGTIALVKNWDKVKAALAKFWIWVKNLFYNIFNFLLKYNPISIIINLLDKLFPGLKDSMKQMVDEVFAWFKKLWDKIVKAFEKVKKVFGFDKNESIEIEVDEKTGQAKAKTPVKKPDLTPPPINTEPDADLKENMSGITSGGSKPTNINISIGKFQDSIQVYANNLDESLEEIEDKIVSKLVQIVNRGNQLQGV